MNDARSLFVTVLIDSEILTTRAKIALRRLPDTPRNFVDMRRLATSLLEEFSVYDFGIKYRKTIMIEVSVRRKVRIPLGENGGEPLFVTFEGFPAREEHIALVFGNTESFKTLAPLVRIHSECLTGDVFVSERCDCGAQLRYSMEQLRRESGVLLYLRQEGRGIGLNAKIDAYDLQSKGHDTFTANLMLGHPEDGRDFSIAAKMLRALGIDSVRLLTNNPQKVNQLRAAGVTVVDVLNTPTFDTPNNIEYLQAKRDRHGHALTQLKSA